MADPEDARAEVCLRGAMIEEQAGGAPQMGRVERVSHHQEHVHVLWFQLVGDERPKYHEPRQVTGRLAQTDRARKPLNSSHYQISYAALRLKKQMQLCGMPTEGEITPLRQLRGGPAWPKAL